MDFEGRTALVTGTTSGIGLCVAQALVGRGAYVIALGPGDAAVRELERPFGGSERVRTLALDIRDRAALEALRDSLTADEVTLDILVANAGTNVRRPALELTDEEIRVVIDTNLYGTFTTLQVLAPLALRRPGARIVVTSSVAAVWGYNLRAPYTASKAGLSGLVRSLAIEWGPFGATVNAVGPGLIRTPLLETYMREHPERVEAAIAHTPLRRFGEPEDVSDVILFLASGAARFITGQTIVVDGGLSVGNSWW